MPYYFLKGLSCISLATRIKISMSNQQTVWISNLIHVYDKNLFFFISGFSQDGQ
jgi:hypothetical protein